MRQLYLLLISGALLAETSFITPEEYAQQLYNNPRGISCAACHGNNGEGKLIANYVHKGEFKSFSAPSINNLEYSQFSKGLNKRKRGMPRYYLTQNEIKALYFYLKNRRDDDTK